MKHAGAEALDTLEPLLEKLRTILRTTPGVVERRRGIFYRGATAFLHFHEDPAGMFADLRRGDDFERYAVNTEIDIARLLLAARAAAAPSPRVRRQPNALK